MSLIRRQKEYTLPIKVLPPIYLSSLAIFTYLFIGTVLIIIAIYRIHYQILKETETNSRQDQGGAKEKLYESKLNFFTHITHELCTPLTLINGVENYIQAYAATSKRQDIRKIHFSPPGKCRGTERAYPRNP